MGCWLWFLVWSVLGGVFISLLFWWPVTALFVAALAVLAKDPDE